MCDTTARASPRGSHTPSLSQRPRCSTLHQTPKTPLSLLKREGGPPREKRRRTSHRQISEGGNSMRRTAHACGGTEHIAKGHRSKGKTGNQERENWRPELRGEGLHLRVLQTRAPKLVIFPPDYDAASSPLHAPPRMLRPRCADPRGKRGDQPTFFFRDQQTTATATHTQPTNPTATQKREDEK